MRTYSRSPKFDPDSKEFGAFASAVRVLSTAQGRNLRERFHDSFLDTNSDFYRERNIRVLIYDRNLDRNQKGFLWDCLRSYRRVDWGTIESAVAGAREVFILFDVYNAPADSPDQGYGPFKRDDVIACRPAYLNVGLPYLPSDLYIFDQTFQWAGVLTQEPWTNDTESFKFLVYADDPLHSMFSSGAHWEFKANYDQEFAHAGVVELWLDDQHFADLCKQRGGEISLRFQPLRPGWSWDVPVAHLEDAVGRATTLFEN